MGEGTGGSTSDGTSESTVGSASQDNGPTSAGWRGAEGMPQRAVQPGKGSDSKAVSGSGAISISAACAGSKPSPPGRGASSLTAGDGAESAGVSCTSAAVTTGSGADVVAARSPSVPANASMTIM